MSKSRSTNASLLQLLVSNTPVCEVLLEYLHTASVIALHQALGRHKERLENGDLIASTVKRLTPAYREHTLLHFLTTIVPVHGTFETFLWTTGEIWNEPYEFVPSLAIVETAQASTVSGNMELFRECMDKLKRDYVPRLVFKQHESILRNIIWHFAQLLEIAIDNANWFCPRGDRQLQCTNFDLVMEKWRKQKARNMVDEKVESALKRLCFVYEIIVGRHFTPSARVRWKIINVLVQAGKTTREQRTKMLFMVNIREFFTAPGGGLDAKWHEWYVSSLQNAAFEGNILVFERLCTHAKNSVALEKALRRCWKFCCVRNVFPAACFFLALSLDRETTQNALQSGWHWVNDILRNPEFGDVGDFTSLDGVSMCARGVHCQSGIQCYHYFCQAAGVIPNWVKQSASFVIPLLDNNDAIFLHHYMQLLCLRNPTNRRAALLPGFLQKRHRKLPLCSDEQRAAVFGYFERTCNEQKQLPGRSIISAYEILGDANARLDAQILRCFVSKP